MRPTKQIRNLFNYIQNKINVNINQIVYYANGDVGYLDRQNKQFNIFSEDKHFIGLKKEAYKSVAKLPAIYFQDAPIKNQITRNGKITAYGFNCGYVEQCDLVSYYVKMYQEHCTYHVRVFNLENQRVLWYVTDSLIKARSAYSFIPKIINLITKNYPKCDNHFEFAKFIANYYHRPLWIEDKEHWIHELSKNLFEGN